MTPRQAMSHRNAESIWRPWWPKAAHGQWCDIPGVQRPRLSEAMLPVPTVSPASATSTDMSLMMASVIKMRQPYCFVTACIMRMQKKTLKHQICFQVMTLSIFCTSVSDDADNMFHHLESGGHVDVGAQIWGVDLKLRADGSLEPQRVETAHAENWS